MNIATTSTVTDSVSALNGWIVFKATVSAQDNHSSDGDGLKVANLSGTNSTLALSCDIVVKEGICS